MISHAADVILNGPTGATNAIFVPARQMTIDLPKSSALPWIPRALYAFAVLLTCIWVLSLPLFPSQDGPMHLYYANAFRQLLEHRPGVYTDTYYIRNYFPPYATYYYGLIALGRFVSLEMADKLLVCLFLVLFAVAGRVLMRAAGARSEWAPLLLLPVLLNWPLLMGFLSYLFAFCLACFALSTWFRMAGEPGFARRTVFLALVVAIAVTHPVPWLLVVGFVFLELGSRLIFAAGGKGAGTRPSLPFWRTDAAVALLACLPYFYLNRFRTHTQAIDPVDLYTGERTFVVHPGLRYQVKSQWFDLKHLRGLTLFDGLGLPRLYRFGLQMILVSALSLAIWYLLRRRRWAQDRMAVLWTLWTLGFGCSLLLIPDNFAGGYFFVMRLHLVLYVSAIVAASFAFSRFYRLGVALALTSFALCLLTVLIAIRYINPVAQDIMTLHQAPVVAADGKPGLLMRYAGATSPPYLSFSSYYWAQANYFRWHNLLLFNTAWLGEPLIPIRPRAGRLGELDSSFFNESPQFRSRLMGDEAGARSLFGKVAFVLFTQQPATGQKTPFIERLGDTQPGMFASGWTCVAGGKDIWWLCQPKGLVGR